MRGIASLLKRETLNPNNFWLSAAPRAPQYFRDVDDALERAEEAHVAMEEAVAGERFADAARLRAELGALEERDSLSRVLGARRRLCTVPILLMWWRLR